MSITYDRTIDEHFTRPWHLIAIPRGEKGAIVSWNSEPPATRETFAERDRCNIAALNGERSDWLVTIDGDVSEVWRAMAQLLPRPLGIYGRESKPESKFIYRSVGAKPQIRAYKGVASTVNGKTITPTLIELRAAGYDVLPGSINTASGRPEVVAWFQKPDVWPTTSTDEAGLSDAVRLCAVVALMARHWPIGNRHYAAAYLADFLARRDVREAEIQLVIRLTAEAARDSEVNDRVTFAMHTLAALKAGKRTKGAPSLEELVTKDVVDRLRDWFDDGQQNSIVDELNARHFVVRIGNTTRIATLERDGNAVFQTERDLHLEYRNTKIQVGNNRGKPIYKTKFDLWVESARRRDYERVLFAPPGSRHPVRDGLDFNLYRGVNVEPGIEPARNPARVARFLAHMQGVICNGNADDFAYLKTVINNLLRYPGRPGEVAVALRSDEQGAGKGDAFAEVLGRAFFDAHWLAISDTSRLNQRFNSFMSGLILLIADEAIWADSNAVRGPLKNLITSKTQPIERKGVDVIREDSCLHLWALTNNLHSAPKEYADRRWFTLHVGETYGRRNPKRREYFDKLFAEIEDPNTRQMRPEFRDALIAEVLSWGDHRRLADPPRSDEGERQAELTADLHSRWFFSCLKNGEFFDGDGWPDVIPSSDLHWSYVAWCKAKNLSGVRLDADELMLRLVEYLGTSERAMAYPRDPQTGRREHEKRRLRVRRLPALGDARATWDQQHDRRTTWPDVDDHDANIEEPATDWNLM